MFGMSSLLGSVEQKLIIAPLFQSETRVTTRGFRWNLGEYLGSE